MKGGEKRLGRKNYPQCSVQYSWLRWTLDHYDSSLSLLMISTHSREIQIKAKHCDQHLAIFATRNCPV